MNWILCGLPMSGKSTIGKLLAEHLSWNFIDTDRLVETEHVRLTGSFASCRQIFLNKGDAYFRMLENKQILKLQGVATTIISLGGGALHHGDNLRILKEIGPIIYLKASAKVIWRRMLANGIPAFLNSEDPEGSLFALAEKRRHIYETAAHFIIDTDTLNEQEIVDEIIRKEINHGK